MPAFDGTGPQGLGPRTGRGWGYCPPEYRRNSMGIFNRIHAVGTQGVILTAVLSLVAGYAIGQKVKTAPRVSFGKGGIGSGGTLSS